MDLWQFKTIIRDFEYTLRQQSLKDANQIDTHISDDAIEYIYNYLKEINQDLLSDPIMVYSCFREYEQDQIDNIEPHPDNAINLPNGKVLVLEH